MDFIATQMDRFVETPAVHAQSHLWHQDLIENQHEPLHSIHQEAVKNSCPAVKSGHEKKKEKKD